MPLVWTYSLISVTIVSLLSLIGILTLSIRVDKLKSVLIYLVSFAAGAMLGDAFIHLLPEIVKETGFTLNISLYVLSGIVIFFIVEKVIQWHHCHFPTSHDHPHPFALMNLFGDAVHNFIDGLIIAASYLVSIPIGIATTIAIILHEIPQEIADFGVLLHGGFSKATALFFNFLTAITAILGAIIALVLSSRVENLTTFLIPFAAGGFIYIAGSDLIPELHKEVNVKKSLLQIAVFIFGILMMLVLLALN